jgi:hypothetical protein
MVFMFSTISEPFGEFNDRPDPRSAFPLRKKGLIPDPFGGNFGHGVQRKTDDSGKPQGEKMKTIQCVCGKEMTLFRQ